MTPTNTNHPQSNPWYLNITMPGYEKKTAYPPQPNHNIYFDPVSEMQNEKVDQADRLLNHTAKALLTRLTLERTHTREREEEIHMVRDHMVQFSDEPFGVNQARDSMRWSLEQNCMALSRESRMAQMNFWNDLWTMSRELLTCMDSHEKLNRRKSMMNPAPYALSPRTP